jgi:hypothetical protein
MVCQWFDLKTIGTAYQWLGLKINRMIFSGLISKSVTTVFFSLGSKPVAMVYPGLASKPVVDLLVEPQNQGSGGFPGLDLKTGNYGLVIWASKSP